MPIINTQYLTPQSTAPTLTMGTDCVGSSETHYAQYKLDKSYDVGGTPDNGFISVTVPPFGTETILFVTDQMSLSDLDRTGGLCFFQLYVSAADNNLSINRCGGLFDYSDYISDGQIFSGGSDQSLDGKAGTTINLNMTVNQSVVDLYAANTYAIGIRLILTSTAAISRSVTFQCTETNLSGLCEDNYTAHQAETIFNSVQSTQHSGRSPGGRLQIDVDNAVANSHFLDTFHDGTSQIPVGTWPANRNDWFRHTPEKGTGWQYFGFWWETYDENVVEDYAQARPADGWLSYTPGTNPPAYKPNHCRVNPTPTFSDMIIKCAFSYPQEILGKGGFGFFWKVINEDPWTYEHFKLWFDDTTPGRIMLCEYVAPATSNPDEYTTILDTYTISTATDFNAVFEITHVGSNISVKINGVERLSATSTLNQSVSGEAGVFAFLNTFGLGMTGLDSYEHWVHVYSYSITEVITVPRLDATATAEMTITGTTPPVTGKVTTKSLCTTTFIASVYTGFFCRCRMFAKATVAHTGIVSESATATMLVDGDSSVRGAVTFSGTADLQAIGLTRTQFDLLLRAYGNMTTSASVTRLASVTLSARALLDVRDSLQKLCTSRVIIAPTNTLEITAPSGLNITQVPATLSINQADNSLTIVQELPAALTI